MKRFIPLCETKRHHNITKDIVDRNNRILNYFYGVGRYPRLSGPVLARKFELGERQIRRIISAYKHLVETK